jgi:hypothetical protein
MNETNSPATLQAIEDALADSLEDTAKRIGMSGNYGDKNYSDPRICDIAAHFLWTRWPERYIFDLAGTSRVRERQRIECLNTWRIGAAPASTRAFAAARAKGRRPGDAD